MYQLYRAADRTSPPAPVIAQAGCTQSLKLIVRPKSKGLPDRTLSGCDGASALLQTRQRGGDCAGALQALLRHPADHLGPARGQDAQPAAHGEPQQPTVQLDADLLVLVLGDDVLEEEDAQLAAVRVRLRRDRRHRACGP